MVYGEDQSISSERDAGIAEGNSSRKQQQCGARFLAIEQLVDASRTNSVRLCSDVQPDVYLARVVVDRRGEFVAEKYERRADGLVRIELGVVLMCTAHEINAQGKGPFLHLAQGGDVIRSRDGDTYLYEDGAPQLFKWVIAESTIQRCGGVSIVRRWVSLVYSEYM